MIPRSGGQPGGSHRPARAILATVVLALSAHAADPTWSVPDAPFRAVVKAKAAPEMPEAGVLIELPEIGQTMPNSADVVLTDGKGAPLAVSKAWRGEGQKVLLLAQTLPAGQDCYVYFGGNRPRRETGWTPKVSLLMETRRLPSANAKLADGQELQSLWKKAAPDTDGAGFVASIDHGQNPFGDSENFITHYTGWLKTDGKKTGLYTLSSDASFVMVGDKFEFGWPGKHAAHANANTVPKKDVTTQGGLTRIDYYHAKLPSEEPATMLLGWFKDGKPEAIPASAWLHPGSADVVKLEHVQGWPVPEPVVQLRTYIGWGGLWMYETRCMVRGSLPSGWTASWEFSDGSKIEGAQAERVLFGNDAIRATVRLKHGNDQIAGEAKITFVGNPARMETSNTAVVDRYVALLEKEAPALLSATTLKSGFQFLNEFGRDQAIGKFATAWLAKNPNQDDPLWIRGQIARLRSLAQGDAKQALAEVRKFDSGTRKKFAKELGMAEIELLVFYLKDPAGAQTANSIGFQNANTDLGRLAKIRVGDLYRLLGKTKEAVAQYQSVQKTVADETAGRKFAAEDRANSITITDLIEQGYRHEAEEKLTAWEIEHPMAKYDSDFLLLRGRVLMEFGRWNEALQEIESFRQMNPDSPYQIPADFHRARALFELGKKDEAKKIWQGIVTKYPKHDLVDECRRWLNRN
jgi:tetratricopeptide (TPR) repeat protein